MSEKLCVTDLHLHTNLSRCAPDSTTVASYLPVLEQEGVKKIGISNHLYTDMGVTYTLQIKEEIEKAKKASGVEILLGCEAEVFAGREATLTKEAAKAFDYVLLAPSHIFNLPHMYADFDLSTTEKIRDLIIQNFKDACLWDLGVPTAICHPLYPICAPSQQEILDSMTDTMLGECYSLAAKQEKSIEIHACLFRDSVYLDEEGLSPSYIRMLSLAKECGCKFHFGSDAHSAEGFLGTHRLLERAAHRAGITKEDLWHLAAIL